MARFSMLRRDQATTEGRELLRRVDPAGEPYHPYHDVQAMVESALQHCALLDDLGDRLDRPLGVGRAARDLEDDQR